MKLLVSIDIEGVAGVFHSEQTRPGNGEYERARRWMTEEANAVVEGALAAGASQVLVADGHAHYRNLLPDLLHPAARLMQGKPRPNGMLDGIDSGVDALMMVGYHARAGSPGILAHTMNGAAFSRIWLDGDEAGEAAIYGALAASHGVPVLLASGDDMLAEEARDCLPRAELVTVKKASGCQSGASLSPRHACALLREASERAVRGFLGRPWRPAPPTAKLACRVQAGSSTMADLFAQLPLVERLDAATVAFDAPDPAYLVRVLNCLSAMSAALR